MQIHDQVWYVNGASCIYLTSDGTLVDTGGEGDLAKIRSLLDEAGLEGIHTIILTHLHKDHAGSARRLHDLTGVPIYAMKNKHDSSPWQAFLSAGGLDQVLTYVEPGEILPILDGGRAIHTPGHTSGHMSVYLEQKGILFSGDALQVKRGRLAPPFFLYNEDQAAMKESSALLEKLAWNLLCPGHREPVRRWALRR